MASRTLGLVTGGLLAGGLTVPAIWTSYAQGAVQGRIDPGLAITRTLAVPRPVPLPPGPIRAGFIPR